MQNLINLFAKCYAGIIGDSIQFRYVDFIINAKISVLRFESYFYEALLGKRLTRKLVSVLNLATNGLKIT